MFKPCHIFTDLHVLMMNARQHQTTLDASFTSQCHVAPFSQQGLIDYLVKLVVLEDEAFNLLNKPAFRQLLLYLHPMLASKDIPHCTKICEEVLTCAVHAESNINAKLQVHPTFICHVKSSPLLQGCQGANLLHV
jgi:hypothetical protein